MAISLFGWAIKRADGDNTSNESFAPPILDDGAAVVQTAPAYGGAMGITIDLEGTIKGEADLITRYRNMAEHSEVDAAIEEIVNQAVVIGDESPVVQLNFEDLEDVLPPELKNAFEFEFKEVQRIMEWNVNSHEIFKRWYIDGRLYYHVIIDKKRLNDGILELRYIDPRKIKKVREVEKKRSGDSRAAVTVQQTKIEYYIYNEAGFDGKQNQSTAASGTTEVGVRIAKDSIIYATSGILDERGQIVLSHLQQAIRPLNMLRTMEDSAVIYRLVRAPERRVWYIDIGNLPKMKAEQAVYDMMQRHKNKMIYDPTSGSIKDGRKFTTMLEDIWLTRRNGTQGTQIDTLESQGNWIQMDEIQYFLKKLYKALKVPLSRLEPEYMYSIGRSSEITRDELKFDAFIGRLQTRFNELFLEILERQLILKGYVSPDEWSDIRHRLRFKWTSDNFFAEMKDQEIMMMRIETLNGAMPLIGRYISNNWARKHILQQTEEEIEEMDEEILEERMNPLYMVQTDADGNPIDVSSGMWAAPAMADPQQPKNDK